MEENKEFNGNSQKEKKGFPKEAIAPIILALATAVLITLLLLLGNGKSFGNAGEVNSGSDEQSIKTKSKIFYEYFDTVSTVYDYSGKSEEEFKENCRLIEEKIKYYHELFDIYNEYEGVTNLATVNRLAATEAVKVDRELIDFLLYSVSMHELTDGNVNIAMGSLLSVWHNYRLEGSKIPSRDELEAASLHTDINCLVIDEENLTVRFTDPEMSLDVGAIAKGYAAEKCADFLKSLGVTAYVLDLGGNLRAIGTKPGGGKWKTGVQNPDMYSDTPYVYYLDIADTSVVTSGDYQRFYTVDGKNYHHIINKDTLFPAEYYSSVTVVTEHSGLADALSTALFNMKMEEAVALLDTLDGVSVIWVYTDGRLETYGI